MWFIVKHSALHLCLLRFQYIWWIANNHVKPAIPIRSIQYIHLTELHTRAIEPAVLTCHLKCAFTDIPPLHLPMRQVMGQCYGNASAAGSYIKQRAACTGITGNPFHKFSCLRTRNKDTAVNPECQPAERS